MLSDFQQMLAPDPEMMSFKPEKLGSRFDTRLLHAHIMTKLLQLCIAFMTASSTAAPAFADKFHLPPAPTQTGKSFFFASSRACVSSGQFSAQECADAFDRVSALLHEHARKFAAEIDCVMKFKLCDKEADGYAPAALGVEIVRSSSGVTAVPMLAVETPREMWREPAPVSAPPPAFVADVAQHLHVPGPDAKSPYGALVFEASSLSLDEPPSLKSYRRFAEEGRLRLAAFHRGSRLNWNALEP